MKRFDAERERYKERERESQGNTCFQRNLMMIMMMMMSNYRKGKSCGEQAKVSEFELPQSKRTRAPSK